MTLQILARSRDEFLQSVSLTATSMQTTQHQLSLTQTTNQSDERHFPCRPTAISSYKMLQYNMLRVPNFSKHHKRQSWELWGSFPSDFAMGGGEGLWVSMKYHYIL